ncbi:MAG: hypothetical protein JW873_02420 [Candidatus Saganbacteria bacterium]|nr:hypothetical protein [Candidatus Saganbacteria bacterium]
MLARTTTRKYTGADVFAAASKMVKDELSALKKHRPLNAEESAKAEALARFISKTVLKEMKLA